ncbi:STRICTOSIDINE SYNTHASE-LIKE 3-like protein [Drosera capensis]
MGHPAQLLATVILLVSLYIGLDPFHHSTIHDFPNFVAFPVEVPSSDLVPVVKDAENLLTRSEILFRDQLQGPESVTFDYNGKGPYTGVADGRVLVWDGTEWKEFAVTSPNRSELCNYKPNPRSYMPNEHICGRPLGLRFDKNTGDMYIADAYFGLLKVGPEGGLATQLTAEAEGVPVRFANDLDIDNEGNVYFSDSSTIYERRNFMQLVFSGDPSGRVLKYDPVTKQTTVIARNIQFPNGVTLSKDGSFLVFAEGPVGRLNRHWLKGEKAGTTELFAILPGHPDNVRTSEAGTFWVAIHCRRHWYSAYISTRPLLRHLIMKLPIPAFYQYITYIGGRLQAMVAEYSPQGELIRVLEDIDGKVVRAVSEVDEHEGKLWMGSVLMNFIAVYDLGSS